MAENPRLTLDIVLADRVVDLVEEGFDLAVRIGRRPDSGLVSRKLAETRMVLCASPEYIARHGHPAHPKDLTLHPVISYSYWSGEDTWSFIGPEKDEVSVRIRSRLHANNGDTCRAAALAHQGVILQPDFLIHEDLRSGSLIELIPEWHASTIPIHAVYPTGNHLPLKVRRLLDFLAEALREPVWQQCSATCR